MDFRIRFHFSQKAGGIQFAAAYAQNTTFGMKQTGYMRLIQARQKFTHCQIAGRAKQHQIKICLHIHRIISLKIFNTVLPLSFTETLDSSRIKQEHNE